MHLERQLVLSREIGHRLGEANATGNLGIVFASQGRLVEAREHYERYLGLTRELRDRQGEAIALYNLGNVLREEGETAAAQARLLECLALCEEIGYQHMAASAHLVLGSIRAAAGDGASGRASLAAARDMAARIGRPGVETLARCHLACLPGGDRADALAAFTANAERLEVEECREARWLLWRATGDRAHLAEAKRLLDEALSTQPAEDHAAMLTNVPLHREIVAAAKEQGCSGPPTLGSVGGAP